MPTIFELRASLGVRILIDSIELESPHPNLSIDGNARRRHAWQSIASAAVDRFLPGADAELPPKKKRGRPKKQKPTPEPTPAHFIVRSTDDARALLAMKPTPIDEKHFACIVCARPFEPLPKHRGRQRLCTRVRCRKDFANAVSRVARAEKGAAS